MAGDITRGYWQRMLRYIGLDTLRFNGATSGSTLLKASAVASGTLTLPAATDTLVGKATTDTLSNKTLVSPAITGNATVSGYNIASVGNALTAAGTNRGTALQLAKEINNITTAGSGTGVILPVGVIGMRITVFNAGANAAQVYASGSETIDTVAGATGVPLTNTKRCIYEFVAANTWISAQLGVVSA